MTGTPAKTRDTRDIVLENVLPHAPELVWRALTSSDLMARWLMPNDFAPVLGRKFTFRAKPIAHWDGIVRCEVLEIVPNRKLVYSWKGGSDANTTQGGTLDSVVTWTLVPVGGGTKLTMVHSGFASPANEFAYNAMGPGWARILHALERVVAETPPA